VYVFAIVSVYIVRYITRRANLKIDSMCVAGFGSCIVLYLFTLTGIIPNRLPLLLGAIFLYPFVWTGVAIKALDTRIKSHLKSIVVCCFSLWMIGLVFWEGSYTFYGMNTSILAEGVISGWPILYITVFRYFIGVAASMFVIGLVRILFENKEAGQSKALDYLADIGKYTLFIYIAPSFLFHLVKEQVVFENEFLSFLFCLVCTLVILLVCYLVGKYVVGRWKLTRITLLGMAK